MIHKQMFGQPSGTVLGIMNAEVKVKGKEKTVLQHTFLVGDSAETAEVHLKMPVRVSLSEMRALAHKMLAFADGIEEEHANPAQERLEKSW